MQRSGGTKATSDAFASLFLTIFRPSSSTMILTAANRIARPFHLLLFPSKTYSYLPRYFCKLMSHSVPLSPDFPTAGVEVLLWYSMNPGEREEW
jgi:hypothetical protein